MSPRLIIASSGFSHAEVRQAFLAALDAAPASQAAAIITTAPEHKEENRWVIATRESFLAMGFARVDFIDVEFDDARPLRDHDVIYLNGVIPFHLLQHLRRSGVDRVLTGLALAGRFLVGPRAGGLVPGPSIALVRAVDPARNVPALTDFRAPGLTDLVPLPHRTLLRQRYPGLDACAAEFQKETLGRLLILEYGEAILVRDNTETKFVRSESNV